jgi:hypothetical protein
MMTGSAILILTVILIMLFTPLSGTAFQFLFYLLSYPFALAASLFSKTVREDLKLIRFDPFNRDEEKVLKARKLSFFKGAAVLRMRGRSGAFGVILLDRFENASALRHERGHLRQLMLMGVATFLITVALPSALILGPYDKRGRFGYYDAPWEALADMLGGTLHAQTAEFIKNARTYYLLGHLIIPAFFWWRRKPRRKLRPDRRKR